VVSFFYFHYYYFVIVLFVEMSSAGRISKSPSQKSKHTAEGSSGIIKVASVDKSTTLRRNGSEKSKSKKGRTSSVAKPKEKKKKRAKGASKSIVDKLAESFGIYLGNVNLQDPRAVEAVQALDLQPWHLRKLKARFNRIDIDGSGNIDHEEFFESVGEERSPFTDKLFALIGT
jgi:hypothetical protein